MERVLAGIGAIFALLAVAAGAFAAHALRAELGPNIAVFETAARYQMYHGLGLLLIAWAINRQPSNLLNWAGWLMVAGTILFSGSLYGLALTSARWFAAGAPFGGVALIAAWLCVSLAMFRR
ncbi:MAG TPA: DUF423 domain-containing protein [Gemmatimonadales bacterium]